MRMGPIHCFLWGGGEGMHTHFCLFYQNHESVLESPPALKISLTVHTSIPCSIGVGIHEVLQVPSDKKYLSRIFAQILPEFCPNLPEYRLNFARIRYIGNIRGGGGLSHTPMPAHDIVFSLMGKGNIDDNVMIMESSRHLPYITYN